MHIYSSLFIVVRVFQFFLNRSVAKILGMPLSWDKAQFGQDSVITCSVKVHTHTQHPELHVTFSPHTVLAKWSTEFRFVPNGLTLSSDSFLFTFTDFLLPTGMIQKCYYIDLNVICAYPAYVYFLRELVWTRLGGDAGRITRRASFSRENGIE